MIAHPRHRAGLDALAARDRLRARAPAVGLDFASNDYLGLAGSDLLKQAALEALNRGVPVGAAGSRLLRGNHPEHEALEEEAAAFFEKNGEGWRDAWNFVDTALRMIENAEYIGPLRVMKEDGITFGPVSEQDAVPDFYPYWFAWVEFAVEEILTRTPKDYQHLL